MRAEAGSYSSDDPSTGHTLEKEAPKGVCLTGAGEAHPVTRM